MNKIAIFLSTILLSGSFCFGQEPIRFQNSTDKDIQIGEKVTDIIVVTSKPNVTFSVQVSDTTVAKIENNQYTTDANLKATIITSGEKYGKADIVVSLETDTIRRRIVVIPKKYDFRTPFYELVDTIAALKSAVSEYSINLQSQKELYEAAICKKGEVCGYAHYKIMAFSLLALAFVLLFFFFVFIIKNIKKSKDIKYYIGRKEYYKAEFYKNKDLLLHERNTMAHEIEKHKKANKQLLADLNELQLEQKRQEELQAQLLQPAEPQPQSLYADAIIDGKFNSVTEYPDDNTIFELKLKKAGDAQAAVIIYKAAEQLVTKRPEFLDGCEKQILGSTEVTMLNEGVAHKDSSGTWQITTIPEVKIS